MSGQSQKAALLLIAIAAISVAGYLLHERSGSTQGRETGSGSGGGIAAAEESDPVTSVAEVPHSSSPLPSIHAKPIRPGGAVKVGDAYWSVTTQDQADWMNRNMFPSQQDLAGISGQSGLGALPRNLLPSDGSDLLLAENVAKMNPSRRNEAVEVLQNGARKGSVFALHALANVAQAEGDHVKAAGFLRAAYMRGDWAAMYALDKALSGDQALYADMMAYQMISNITAWRSARGLPPLQSDIRPGLAEAIAKTGAGK